MTDKTHFKTYQIFGRKTYPEPLSFVETVQVVEGVVLQEQVFQQVGESGWVELVALPVEDILQVIPWEASP